MIKFVGAAILVVLLSSRSNSQQELCTTVSRETGTCINLQNCPSLNNLLRGSETTSDSIQLLKSSGCGWEGGWPKVCCKNEEATTKMPTYMRGKAPDVTTHPNLRLLNVNECGRGTQKRILNGQKTHVFEYPWMALIAYKLNGKIVFRCGGTILNQRYVLTAAHCVTELPGSIELFGVRLGEHDISKERDCEYDENGSEIECAAPYQDFGIESSHYHPNFSTAHMENDIALIRLDSNADFGPATVRPVCLPIGSAATITARKVIVAGWGVTEKGSLSAALMQVALNIVAENQCARVWQHNATITSRQLCAGGTDRRDACFGDSGGPLKAHATFGKQTRMVQYGIVSFGPQHCGVEAHPSVYTKLSSYLDWVLNTIRE